jgi:hypothetical protein
MKAPQPIHYKDLTRSLTACYRIEDAIWRLLRDEQCSERSSAVTIRLAIEDIRQRCPAWCEPKAWERIADMFSSWATATNSLELFWKLRRKQTADLGRTELGDDTDEHKEQDDDGRQSPLSHDHQAHQRAA